MQLDAVEKQIKVAYNLGCTEDRIKSLEEDFSHATPGHACAAPRRTGKTAVLRRARQEAPGGNAQGRSRCSIILGRMSTSIGSYEGRGGTVEQAELLAKH
eukprot:5974082-Pyramimonas_sp.AAC.1